MNKNTDVRIWVIADTTDSDCRGQMLYLERFQLRFDYENGYVLAYSQDSTFYCFEGYGEVKSKTKFVEMKYTGLCDKSGLRVFEGDIVRQQLDYNNDPQSIPKYQWSSKTWQVVWSELEHRFGLLEQNFKYDGKTPLEYLPVGLSSENIEVVGNIFENQ